MGDSFDNYFQFVRTTIILGRPVSPRGHATLELTGTEFLFPATRMFYRPGMNPSLGWAELMMLLGGLYDPEVIRYAAPRADMSLYNPKLMYGPRVRDQYAGLIDTLRTDSASREAILIIGSGEDGCTWDQPCTTSIQFLVRRGVVNAFVNMRSQDLLKGLPYDVVMFGGLTQSVALELGLQSGMVTIRHGSAHVYASDLERMSPISERIRRYNIKVPLLLANTVMADTLKLDWKPTPHIVECDEWAGK